MTEADVIRVVMESATDEALVVANGFLSREAFRCKDRPNNFYMLGSMGLASSIGLGVALVQRRRRVVVIDGDGNLLMSLGALAMAGYIAVPNFIHIVIDNQQYASTGGQASISGGVQMASLALSSGYRFAWEVADEVQLSESIAKLRSIDGPTFLRACVTPGTEVAARVSRSPEEIARTFQTFLLENRV